ncbi:MAG: hypothetical protein AAF957_20405 [Planctomycetota bacterium]
MSKLFSLMIAQALLAAAPLAATTQRPDPHASWAVRGELDASSPYRDLTWQAVGPRFCGGRIESIAVPAGHPYRLYVAPGSGNLFRSDDGGLTWTPIFEHEPTHAIGCVEVAPSDPDVVWVGTGEAHLGGVSWDGVGVFRSDDGGSSWRAAGLEDSRRIGKVRAHPEDADIAWVAVISGKDEAARGVWKTVDGGGTWMHVLETEARVAAIDLVSDPADPGHLYAATWDRKSGDGSGVHRSRDGGETWVRLEEGLPRGSDIERVAVDLCRAQPKTVYALTVDRRKPGEGRYGVGGVVYRSNDGGDTWKRCHADFVPTYVGWDFCDVKVDPRDPERLYVCGQELIVSANGGATWLEVSERIRRLLPFEDRLPSGDQALHLDAHELWIDPERPMRLLLGNDGGLFESLDGGDTWLHRNTLPITELYTAYVDDDPSGEWPFRIWVGSQDNGSLVGPPIPIDDDGPDPWRHVFLDRWNGGDGFATRPDPTNDDVVYFEHQMGGMRRKQRSGSVLSGRDDTSIRPDGDGLQFAWNTPLFPSDHEPTTLFTAAQFVFRSPDRGDSWTKISPDLGNGSALLALVESPVTPGLLHAGSASGAVHVGLPSESDEAAWEWTEAAELPGARVADLYPSPHHVDRVWVVHSARRPRVFLSEDLGETWLDRSAGLPEAETVRAVLEDPRDPDIVYVGTDLGVCVSTDAGETWHSLSTTLPTTPVLDLAFHAPTEHLVAATHGRGVFVLDVSSVQ